MAFDRMSVASSPNDETNRPAPFERRQNRLVTNAPSRRIEPDVDDVPVLLHM
jgi:hypothetical protein